MAKGDPNDGGAGYFPGVYQSAVEQTGEDYDSIMGQYKQLGERTSNNPTQDIGYSPLSPTTINLTQSDYAPEADYSQLEDIASTGGFSEGDIGNIRARAVSPIRSIYSSAAKNLLRQKSLSGGYSPNYAAASAKMARESSSLISDKTTDANASIAEMVQRGKLTGATALAPLKASEAARRQSWSDNNANVANQAAIFNAQSADAANRRNQEVSFETNKLNRSAGSDDFNKILETIKGQQSTYGTTPALANTFGSQVLSAANTVNNFPPIQRRGMSGTGIPANGALIGGIGNGSDPNAVRNYFNPGIG